MKTLNLFFISIFILALPQLTIAQNHSSTIKVQAMQMGNAVVRNDFETFVKYMHPNIIAFAGGRQEMKNKMDSAYVAMAKYKVKFKTYLIGNPGEIVRYKNQLQAILPQTTTMQTPMGEVILETTMLVISNDNGKNWWFIDTNVYKADKLKNVLPDISPRLVLPPPGKPKLGPVKKK